MAESTYRISFKPRPGSLGTQVDYRIQNGSWITPSAPTNPTTLSYYELSLTKGQTYDIRLSSIGNNCSPKYKYITIQVPLSGTCCPSGYTLSPEQDYCYKVEEIPATPPSDAQSAVSVTNGYYSRCGSLIYDVGFSLNGNGTHTAISTSNAFWINNTGGSPCSTGNTTNGPLNRNGVWTTDTADNQTVGFSVCIDIDETKTYYIGAGFDNYGIIKIDGEEILETDNSTTENVLEYWKIYPVTLTSGIHFIEVIGKNGVSAPPNPGVIGVEIYDNTSSEITTATSYADLNIIFKSADYIGQPIQIGSEGYGYSCPPGYALSCSPPYVCKRILTEPTFSC